MAAALNMPIDNPVLAAILAKLPHDFDWEGGQPLYDAYREQHVERYHLAGLQKFDVKERKEKEVESVYTNTSSQKSSGLKELPCGSPDGCIIKIENPKFLEYQAQLKVCQSAKLVLEKILPRAQDFMLKLAKKADKDHSMQTKATNFTIMVNTFDSFLKDLRELCMTGECLTNTDMIDDSMFKLAEDYKTIGQVHQTGINNQMKILTPLLV